MKSHRLRNILLLEMVAFGIVIAAILVNEFFDLPYYLFNRLATPINYEEAFVESAFILVLASIVLGLTYHLLRRIADLEKLLPICMFCKKIRLSGADPAKQESWQPIEMFIHGSAGTKFSHGCCPECEKKHLTKES